MENNSFDFAIIGSGIIGLSLAYELILRNPKVKIVILEKEAQIGLHASGRNSGVLHSGIFYPKDTLKAKVCRIGSEKLKQFAVEHNIRVFCGGKVLIPHSANQFSTLDSLMNNAIQNKIPAQWLDEKQLLELEPYARPASKSIYCPTTAVIDIKDVLEKLVKILQSLGVTFSLNTKVLDIQSKAKQLMTSKGKISYQFLFNCAGAYADQLAKKEGLAQDYTLLPFKGIYYKLANQSAFKVRSNIYPIPNPSKPFLGVHFTRALNGDVYVGPTAIPAFGRENYHGFKGLRVQETFDLSYQIMKLLCFNQHDFRKLATQEFQKYIKQLFFKDAQKLLPSLKIKDLEKCSKAGIRPQLMNKKNKSLEMDYIFQKTDSSIHILNAISPAFTSSFAFAEMIIEQAGI
ncbi:MAG TPA: L-2-hydroxyglutarate oxidase [Legionellales bacterium]|nr:L-2-hydroxyglutarate oxidase [Legionellales bacterium]